VVRALVVRQILDVCFFFLHQTKDTFEKAGKQTLPVVRTCRTSGGAEEKKI
jgi:hypothetical protein